jgi:DNA-binding LytR/AlgR family response regulator
MKEESTVYDVHPFLPGNLQEAIHHYEKVPVHGSGTFLEFPPVVAETRPPQSPRIGIKSDGRILFMDPKDLVSVHAEGNYVMLRKESGSHLLRASISEMDGKLSRYGFIRIHRSVLVNRLFVEEMQPYPTGNYGLRLKGGKVYTVSRTYKQNLKSLADYWIGINLFAGE